MEATYPAGGNQQLTTGSPQPQVAINYFQQVPAEYTVENLLDASSAGITQSDPHSTGGTDYSTAGGDLMEVVTEAGQRQPVLYPLGLAGPTAATDAEILRHEQHAYPEDSTGIRSVEVNAAPGLYQPVPRLVGLVGPTIAAGEEILHQQNSHAEWDWPGTNPGLSQTQLPPYSAGEPSSAFTATGTEEEIVQSGRALLGFSMQEVNAALTQPDQYSYSIGDSTCPSTPTPTPTDMGISSPDLDVTNQAGLPQSGGGALTEAPERGSCKRKCLSSSSTEEADLVRSDPWAFYDTLARMHRRDECSTDIKPPDGSTPCEIIQFLNREKSNLLGKWINRSIAEQDQTAPVAQRRYVTNMRMMPDQKTHHGGNGYWQEKADYQVVRTIEGSIWRFYDVIGIKRTFRFHTSNGKETNWFMHEYIPASNWGIDLYLQDLYFREVFEVAGKQRVNTNNRIVSVKHRKRGPDDPMVVKGESAAWQHLIKIYDRHPELEGSKVVYAVCCRCEGVLKAGTGNGTSSLLTHCKSTCPNRNKNQQQASSSR